ncbi:MAG: hypothetical protein WBM38_12885 [Arenicellales bacterium]|jgi:hypothetical protein
MLNTYSTVLVRLITGLLLCHYAYADEAVYLRSAEPCLVDAYTAPAADVMPEKLKCGEKASVLERKDNFARIQLNNEKIVWVTVANTTPSVPAELEVQRLIKYQEQIEAELASLKKQVTQLSETSTKLINTLIEAEAAKKK